MKQMRRERAESAHKQTDWKQQLQELREQLPQPEFSPEESLEDVMNRAEAVDRVVWDRHPDLRETLTEYGVPIEGLEITEVHPNIFELRVKQHFHSKRLPYGYAYKGGAARSLLAKALELQPAFAPRDVDVVRFAEIPSENDDEVAERFMPDDHKHNESDHPTIDAIDNGSYFQTRDVTISEVYATDEYIVATKQCILDTVRHIIRPTQYELNRFDYGLGYKMRAKTIRFWVEALHRYGEAESYVTEWEYAEEFIKPFWLLLQLDKALEINPDIAIQFVQRLQELRQLPDGIVTPQGAIVYLLQLINRPTFRCRYAPHEQIVQEAEWFDERDEHDFVFSSSIQHKINYTSAHKPSRSSRFIK